MKTNNTLEEVKQINSLFAKERKLALRLKNEGQRINFITRAIYNVKQILEQPGYISLVYRHYVLLWFEFANVTTDEKLIKAIIFGTYKPFNNEEFINEIMELLK